MALHAQARELAQHGRIRTRCARVAVSGSPHRRQANPRPRSQRMAGPPQQAPRQGQLAIQNRRRPRQAEETVPSVRVTRATSLLLDAETDRTFAGGGHSLDFINKAFECLDLIGWEQAGDVLPTVVGQMVTARGAEESTANGMVRPCSLPYRRVTLGGHCEGALPCPTNPIRPLPRWASISARIRSMSLVLI